MRANLADAGPGGIDLSQAAGSPNTFTQPKDLAEELVAPVGATPLDWPTMMPPGYQRPKVHRRRSQDSMNGKKKMIDSFKKAAVIGAGTTGRESIRLYWAGSRNPWSACRGILGQADKPHRHARR